MIKYLLLLLLPLSIYASKILSYNIYERTDRADVMITFDTPFNGVIKQSSSSSKIIIKLSNTSIESSKIKRVSSKYLQSLSITPLKNYTQITALVPSFVKVVASKTSDAYGLRLRFKSKTALQKPSKSRVTADAAALSNPFAALPTKKNTDLSNSYYLVVSILVIGIIILLVIKKRIQTPPKEKPSNSWLFKSNQEMEQQAKQEPANNSISENVSIRFQKQINDDNSVVMIDFLDQSYLVLMGNSNILLDKFKDEKPSTQEEFETILQDRHRELEDFLGSNSTQAAPIKTKEPLQSYHERAASLVYGEDH